MIKDQAQPESYQPVGIPKQVETAQELGVGKYIKKPYILEKSGLQLRKNWRNNGFGSTWSDAILYHCCFRDFLKQVRVTFGSPA